MSTVLIRFYEELNQFLPRELRKQEYWVSNNDTRSVKDLIESQGVPHTEVDLILANGISVGFDYKVCDQDKISVYPQFETLDISRITQLGRPPLRRLCFIADVNLGKLSRNLRLLGLDCYYNNVIDDFSISQVYLRERRIVLTQRSWAFEKKSDIAWDVYPFSGSHCTNG